MYRIINDIQTIIKNAMSENLPEVSPDALEEKSGSSKSNRLYRWSEKNFMMMKTADGSSLRVMNHIDSPVGTRLIRKSSEEFEEDKNQPAFMEKWK